MKQPLIILITFWLSCASGFGCGGTQSDGVDAQATPDDAEGGMEGTEPQAPVAPGDGVRLVFSDVSLPTICGTALETLNAAPIGRAEPGRLTSSGDPTSIEDWAAQEIEMLTRTIEIIDEVEARSADALPAGLEGGWRCFTELDGWFRDLLVSSGAIAIDAEGLPAVMSAIEVVGSQLQAGFDTYDPQLSSCTNAALGRVYDLFAVLLERSYVPEGLGADVPVYRDVMADQIAEMQMAAAEIYVNSIELGGEMARWSACEQLAYDSYSRLASQLGLPEL